ncbi:MAG: hypothetical protein A2W61_03655 [Deltaproteobacteria bacterium RIFCSPLOWO2_01_44_7]|nr:MAG: hypothetical protein A2712_06640 [Deltaproteobacteria bacterium RIFCSPHIGHO2_01_FULL_43_49]OGQ15631.1 MAG: hypothetical protein A3D22_05430 [Deltaproteobacteria bacterium RIFCSPHIGHO2_02_FULL_44_53]OGQ28600.1 MAG: hypothetical protein A3D98_00165 [Deltaproteobacteria bacterium RIFCSPHIGHO2_12_FULL_44_21]OGQ31922.1 MAG: hypothetical protein A2979_02370 [Deltaproteobacteria bacterium RIFCSPLOWO2_01_FULL_45_74]OGQ38464.1 MAG: hypothetical protein A2W61_03655 [Deltaproteobacteria bacterium 
MANCGEKNGFKVNGSFWPPAIQIGYVDSQEANETGVCTETVNGVQVGTYNNFKDSFQGLQIGLFNKGENVKGLSLGIVNAHERITGLHIGLWNYVRQEARTIGIGLVNQSDGNLIGGHIGLFNQAGEIMQGFQLSFANLVGAHNKTNYNIAMKGFQVSLANSSVRNMSGLQIGMFNVAEFMMDGVQIAIFNAGGSIVGGMNDGLHIGIFNSSANMNGRTIGILNFSGQCKYFTPLTGSSCLFGPAEKPYVTPVSDCCG